MLGDSNAKSREMFSNGKSGTGAYMNLAILMMLK
jgi:hypothetical protein